MPNPRETVRDMELLFRLEDLTDQLQKDSLREAEIKAIVQRKQSYRELCLLVRLGQEKEERLWDFEYFRY